MTREEEFAVWLVTSGAEDSATDDLNEGEDPLGRRGEPLGDDEHREASVLALSMAAVIEANPEQFVAWYRSIQPWSAS